MAKRQWSGLGSSAVEVHHADAKHLRTASAPRDAYNGEARLDAELVEAEYFMEQHLVGWIIGKSGATLREIEQSFGVKVVVDQSTKDRGYSRVHVTGDAALVQQAAEHMNSSLARATASSSADGSAPPGPFLMDSPPGQESAACEELDIEQIYIGWLLGKGGVVVREIEQASGCKVVINQETRNQGFSRAQIHGSLSERSHAKQLILDSIERAKAAAPGNAVAVPIMPQVVQEVLQVEQKWVGWLLGKGGGLAKEIEQESGAKVMIDQSTQSLGYSSVQITGEAPQVEFARQRVLASLDKVGAAPMVNTANSSSGTHVRIDQQWVGWLLGKSGTVLKEIEAATGAKVTINQDTKPQGYSVAIISGSAAQVAEAFAQVSEKVRQVNPAGDGLSLATGRAAPAVHVAPAARGRAPLAAPVQAVALPVSRPPLVPLRASGGWHQGGPSAGLAEEDQTLEMQVEQKWIGWLLGSGGKTIREIETETRSKITVDQSTKELGFSVVRLRGSLAAVQFGQQRVQGSLSLVDPSGAVPAVASAGVGATATQATAAVGGEEALQVEQRWIGWLLGKGGIVLKEIEAQSGARVTIDQSTKELGFSTVRINGDWTQGAAARRLIEDKIAQAQPGGGMHGGG